TTADLIVGDRRVGHDQLIVADEQTPTRARAAGTAGAAGAPVTAATTSARRGHDTTSSGIGNRIPPLAARGPRTARAARPPRAALGDVARDRRADQCPARQSIEEHTAPGTRAAGSAGVTGLARAARRAWYECVCRCAGSPGGADPANPALGRVGTD